MHYYIHDIFYYDMHIISYISYIRTNRTEKLFLHTTYITYASDEILNSLLGTHIILLFVIRIIYYYIYI